MAEHPRASQSIPEHPRASWARLGRKVPVEGSRIKRKGE